MKAKKKKKRDLMRSIIKSLDDYCEKKLKNFYDENDYDFTIMMKNMWKSNLIQMASYQLIKR